MSKSYVQLLYRSDVRIIFYIVGRYLKILLLSKVFPIYGKANEKSSENSKNMCHKEEFHLIVFSYLVITLKIMILKIYSI